MWSCAEEPAAAAGPGPADGVGSGSGPATAGRDTDQELAVGLYQGLVGVGEEQGQGFAGADTVAIQGVPAP